MKKIFGKNIFFCKIYFYWKNFEVKMKTRNSKIIWTFRVETLSITQQRQ